VVGMRTDIYFNAQSEQHHKDVMAELLRRDKNHPSVVMWSVSNEPICDSTLQSNYFTRVINFTRVTDPTKRPLTIAAIQTVDKDLCGGLLDVVSVNRYYGWYSDAGALPVVSYQINYDLNTWYNKFGKPIILSEYGADTVPGLHREPSVMFTEEFQIDFFQKYWNVVDDLRTKFVIGELVWNFADFRTAQGTTRINALNYKGVFTRQREPKPVARLMKQRYEALTAEYKLKDQIGSDQIQKNNC